MSPIPFYEIRVKVARGDIDEMDHANNVCYIRWMQDAATAHSFANGWDTPRYLEFGSGWYARKHTIEYLAPAFEDEDIIVRTWIADWKGVRSTRKYKFIRATDGVVLAEAETCWAFVNFTTKRPVKIPEAVRDSFLVMGPDDPAATVASKSA